MRLRLTVAALLLAGMVGAVPPPTPFRRWFRLRHRSTSHPPRAARPADRAGTSGAACGYCRDAARRGLGDCVRGAGVPEGLVSLTRRVVPAGGTLVLAGSFYGTTDDSLHLW